LERCQERSSVYDHMIQEEEEEEEEEEVEE
jgi:hypothetical protein